MADVPVPKEERDRVFRKLLAKADNRTCFDCPQRKPIWASSTFGVFICLDCAGGQRRLGTHLTFVRSVDMDTWTRGQLEAMKRGGNGRARDFFRAHGARDLHIRQDTKYASSTARQYRDRLAKEVQQALQGGAAPSPLATPELPKKSFFEDFEPMEMPPRTQSSPALATPAASVKMPVPRAEPDAPGAFAFLRYAINVEGDSPEVCLGFTHPLDPDTDYEPYVAVTPQRSVALSASGRSLCVGGLVFGEEQSLVLLMHLWRLEVVRSNLNCMIYRQLRLVGYWFLKWSIVSPKYSCSDGAAVSMLIKTKPPQVSTNTSRRLNLSSSTCEKSH